ncbi:nitroreductase [Priestia megaterium]|uniref:nitroreductase n=1 Tax=Priestia megaterium TaxID=1404 RepID=UPI00279605FA|nr:nitroreductase [Priestia megaterium]
MVNNSFQKVIRERRSVRKFLPTPLKEEVIRAVLEDAQFTPSNCNTQPWDVHIVSGVKKDELVKALLEAYEKGNTSLDFTFDEKDFFGEYSRRQKAQGKAYYEALGVAREDYEGRKKAAANNFKMYDAPHVALLFMPSVGDDIRVAADIGMYGQSLLLALTARGIGSVPQTVLGMYADTVREVLGVSSEMKLLFGISFGYPDKESLANSIRIGRDPIEESVTFHY